MCPAMPGQPRCGYTPAYAAAITAIGSTIGGIIPPSIAMIVLASSVNLSVSALFAGGMLPGILIGLLLMLTAWVIAKIKDHERGDEPFTISAFLSAAWGASLALSVPLILVVGIFGGWFSSVEAGAITALVALILGTLVYRDLDLASFLGALNRTVRMSASVFVIIAAAGPFTWLLARLGALEMLQGWLLGFADTPLVFALMLLGLVIWFFAGAARRCTNPAVSASTRARSRSRWRPTPAYVQLQFLASMTNNGAKWGTLLSNWPRS